MKIHNITSVGAALVSLCGCGSIYDGAIYTSYDQFNLGIRAAPETASPVNINFGREHAVVSFVPHRDEKERGEAVSLFAWSDTQTINLKDTLTTTQANVNAAAQAAKKAAETAKDAAADASAAASTGKTADIANSTGETAAATRETEEAVSDVMTAAEDNEDAAEDQAVATQASLFSDGSLVKAQGKFASGNAAKVLVIPEGTQVEIKNENQETSAAIKLNTPTEERVTAAFASTTRFPTPEARDYNELALSANGCAKKAAVYAAAASKAGDCFDAFYNKKGAFQNPAARFDLARYDYLHQCKGASRASVNGALEQSIKDNCN